MKILIHVCCAPCAIYPLNVLKQNDFQVMGYFYRSNIHPFLESEKRKDTLKNYADSIGLKVIYEEDYNLEFFLQQIAFRESNRCQICYYERLRKTALIAKKGKFDYFTTTLLYSKFQNHELIRTTGEAIAKSHHLKFYYSDFRDGWQEGISKSKELEMYRQAYCGCIYSEKERYSKKHLKKI